MRNIKIYQQNRHINYLQQCENIWTKTILRGKFKAFYYLYILKKSTTTLTLQNMFRSIIHHRQLQVVHDEFEFDFKLQCELTLLHCR